VRAVSDRVVAGRDARGALPVTATLALRLPLPYARPLPALSANWRGHWSSRASATRQVRADVLALARQAGLHRYQPGDVEHVTVQVVWAPGDNRRRDSGNLAPFVKAAVDGIARGPRKDWVGLDLVPDDTPEFLTDQGAVILPPPAPPGMWIDLQLRLAPGAADRSPRRPHL
jgi:crossover junction endodeoxyribonuclease RusA